MTSSGLTALILGFSITAPALKEPAPKVPAIVGHWQETTVGGGLQYEFTKAGEWIISHNGKVQDGTTRTFKLEPKDGPTAIDLTETPMPYLGVFKLEADTLTICFRYTGEGGRPADVDFSGEGVMKLKFTRMAPKE